MKARWCASSRRVGLRIQASSIHSRQGVRLIVERTPVPVIPMALRGLWGSFFSRYGGEAFSLPVDARLRRGFRSRLELVIGEPVPPEIATPELLMQRVQQLRARNYKCRPMRSAP